MKKKFFFPVAILACVALASCDAKLCYCYEAGAGGVYEKESYVNTDTPCNSMSTSSRTCVESHERMNPDDIAWK